MKVKYYEDADLLSVRTSSKEYRDATRSGDVVVHYAENGEPVLIEILNASKFLKDTDKSLPKKVKQAVWSEIPNVTIPHQIRR